ncbi:MAG TPA: hypothetical protein VIW48_01515, partial [Nitrospiraceae bacterium]
ARIGTDLFFAPSLDQKTKEALADFSQQVSENQGSLQCANPLPAPPKGKESNVDSKARIHN